MNKRFEDYTFIARLDHSDIWKRWSGPWEESGPAVLEAVMKTYPGKIFALVPGSKIGVEDRDWRSNREHIQ